MKNSSRLQEIFEELKGTNLNDLDMSISEKDISLEEKEFRIAIYNYFLQQRQKKIINNDFKM